MLIAHVHPPSKQQLVRGDRMEIDPKAHGDPLHIHVQWRKSEPIPVQHSPVCISFVMLAGMLFPTGRISNANPRSLSAGWI